MLTNSQVTAILPAVNLDRARKFYEQKLGLKIQEANATDILYECGQGTMLYLYQRGQTKADHTAAGFSVDNIEAQMNDLRSRGVVFEEYDFPGLKTENGVAMMGHVKSAWFRDTEGNILALTQRF